MKPKLVTTAAVVVIGAGAFLAGRSSVSTDGSSSATHANEGRGGSRLSHLGSSGGDSDRSGRGKADTRTAKSSTRAATKDERLAKLENILRGEDPLARSRALLDYLDQLDPSEIQDAVERFRSLGITDNRFGEYSMMLTAWAKIDPTGALAYAKENTRGGFATNAILTAWATNDPDAAIRWAEANHQGEEANPYMAGIIRGLAASDPTRASNLLTAMPFSEQRGEALAGLLPHILTQGDSAAREWISSIQDERLRNGAMERVADRLAQKDPKGTADWLLANPGEAAQRNMDDVLSTWMGKDQQGATAYYQALPSGDARTNALRGIVNSLAQNNPQEAANFMERHPADVNDRVVQQFVWNSMGSDPGLATNYIAKIADQGARDNMYRRTIDNWMRRDEPAARAWLQNNRLPDSMQAYVQRRLGQ